MTVPSYWAMHRRLVALRGPAAGQRCAECGAQAVLWCYDETDLDEQRDPTRGHRYSLDPARYRPRCRVCHRRASAHVTVARIARMVRLYEDGASLAGIAARLGLGRPAVRSALLTRGVTIRPPGSRPRTVVDAERAADLYAGGASLRGIAALLGASVPAVRAAIAARGVAIRAPGPCRRHLRRATARSTVTFRPLPTSRQPDPATRSAFRHPDPL